MFNPFRVFRTYAEKFNTGLSAKAKAIIVGSLVVFSFGSLYVAYRVNDYFENNPKACSTCHVHDAANKAWVVSEHGNINCHECHHSTKIDQMRQLYNFIVLGHNKVSPRHGEVIVPWKRCFSCHWERDPKFPKAIDISRSRYHAKHVFIEKIECTKCHGYRTHKFTLEERYCITCHKDKGVKPHGTGSKFEECGPMENLPCLNCHTDRTANLLPGRNKCLYCHGSEENRKEILAGSTIDSRHFLPSEDMVRKSKKISVPKDAPMQFLCYDCHNPHKKLKPDSGDCLSKCHSTVPSVGKHDFHMNMNMKCLDCHKAHVWRVTEEFAKKNCVKCHEYKDPKRFLQ